MVKNQIIAAILATASLVSASPCPFGQLYEEGKLGDAQTEKFLRARGEGEEAVKQMMLEHRIKKRADPEYQQEVYDWQVKRGLLPLGGGLLNGVLQPFTGQLSSLALPIPQEFGLALIPDTEHPYEAPESTDVRGMCPTLNTMANHGYINRNGITTFAQAADACQITLGFGYDTCVFLSALGLISGGDLLSGIYSIGGEDSRVPNTLGPSLGISHHGPFEVDQSISRQDTYFGNQANFELSRWNQFVGIANERHEGLFGMEMWADERQITYTQSRDTNPEFDALAKGLAVTLAERVFIFRALPNGTDEGLANYANVAPFFLNETFPDHWFRRSTPYSLAGVAVDILDLYLMGPTQPGVNQGLNNFVPLDLDFGQLTPTEVECFLLVNLIDLLPGQFSPAVSNAFDLYTAFFQGAVAPFFADASCTTDYTDPGPDAGTTFPGVSTTENILANGVYS